MNMSETQALPRAGSETELRVDLAALLAESQVQPVLDELDRELVGLAPFCSSNGRASGCNCRPARRP